MRLFIFLAVLFILGGCASATISNNEIANEVTENAYKKERESKGVAIMAINWGRRWNCAGFENAEIMGIGFDRLPLLSGISDDAPAQIFLDGPPRVSKKNNFDTYALLVQPGEYALSYAKIKAARSVSDVGFFTGLRSELVADGVPKFGSFKVGAGESVYIGHFYLDCAIPQHPVLWRYYADGEKAFDAFIKEDLLPKYPFLPTKQIKYRLFETTTIGHPYELN